MNFNRFSRVVSRLTQTLAIIFICTLLLFSNVLPANAASANTTQAKSDSTEGSVRLDNVQKKSEEALRHPPLDMQSVQDESNQGLNEIQGAADVQDMNRPSNSQRATSIEEKAEQILEKVKGKS